MTRTKGIFGVAARLPEKTKGICDTPGNSKATYRLAGRIQVPEPEVRCFQKVQVAENSVQNFLTRAVILECKMKNHVSSHSGQINVCFVVYVTTLTRLHTRHTEHASRKLGKTTKHLLRFRDLTTANLQGFCVV